MVIWKWECYIIGGDPESQQPNESQIIRICMGIGPLQLANHVVQNRLTEGQTSHWHKTNKGNYHLKLCMPFVCLVPVRLLLSSTAVLYHVNG